MFKKLRNKLIFFNVGILTVLLLVIFGSLYITTYNDVHNRIDSELLRLLEPQGQDAPDEPLDDPLQGDPIQSVSFVLEITDGVISNSFSRIDFTQDFYDEIFIEATDIEGSFTVDSQTWQYKSKDLQSETLYAFTNITNNQALLTSTLTSYVTIFIISFILVALISYFITSKSIKPVKETFDNQKRFISDASHELKTPLTVINANVDVLLSQNSNEEDKKWLGYIQKEVSRMNKLTHNLLYLANVGNEEATITTSELDISSELESLVLGVEALVYEKDIKLEYNIDPSLEVLFNQEQLNQAIMILLDNAIKYTPNKGVISVSLNKTNNHVSFKIKNTGKGINEENIPHLFDRFYKIDESRQNTNESYGLGLSILKAICDQHNAKIYVSSEVDSYTEFTIKFQ